MVLNPVSGGAFIKPGKETYVKLQKNTVVKLVTGIRVEVSTTLSKFWKGMDKVKKGMLEREDQFWRKYDDYEFVKEKVISLAQSYKIAKYAIVRKFESYGYDGSAMCGRYDCALMDSTGIILALHRCVDITQEDKPDTIKTLKLAKSLKNRKYVKYLMNKSYLSL